MSRRERLEAKLEKRQDWAQKAQQRADARFHTAHEIGKDIPLGQPILVGHHSEKHARRDAERITQNMAAGCAELDKAKHHCQAAAGLTEQLDHSIFSDDDNALEALEARIAEREKTREQFKAVNAAIRKHKKAGEAAQIAALVALDIPESAARKLLEPDFCGRIGIPDFQFTNLGAAIRKDKERIEAIKAHQARQEKAEASSGILIEGEPYCRITFAEKPERSVLTALKAAGFHWSGGSWHGKRSDLPEEVTL